MHSLRAPRRRATGPTKSVLSSSPLKPSFSAGIVSIHHQPHRVSLETLAIRSFAQSRVKMNDPLYVKWIEPTQAQSKLEQKIAKKMARKAEKKAYKKMSTYQKIMRLMPFRSFEGSEGVATSPDSSAKPSKMAQLKEKIKMPVMGGGSGGMGMGGMGGKWSQGGWKNRGKTGGNTNWGAGNGGNGKKGKHPFLKAFFLGYFGFLTHLIAVYTISTIWLWWATQRKLSTDVSADMNRIDNEMQARQQKMRMNSQNGNAAGNNGYSDGSGGGMAHKKKTKKAKQIEEKLDRLNPESNLFHLCDHAVLMAERLDEDAPQVALDARTRGRFYMWLFMSQPVVTAVYLAQDTDLPVIPKFFYGLSSKGMHIMVGLPLIKLSDAYWWVRKKVQEKRDKKNGNDCNSNDAGNGRGNGNNRGSSRSSGSSGAASGSSKGRMGRSSNGSGSK